MLGMTAILLQTQHKFFAFMHVIGHDYAQFESVSRFLSLATYAAGQQAHFRSFPPTIAVWPDAR